VRGLVPPPDHKAITDAHGTNLIGADEALSTVLGILMPHDLRGQRLPCLHDCAQVIEELPFLITRQALDGITSCLSR
jgi:hypothetical protein